MYKLLTIMMVSLLVGCSTLQLDQPQVSVIGFKPARTNGLDAVFELDLRISNPNGITLPIRGISYEFSINNAALLRGVSNNIGDIPSYGSKDVSVQISTSLFSAPKLVMELIKQPSQEISYQLTTKLDLVGALPTLRVVESGSIAANGIKSSLEK